MDQLFGAVFANFGMGQGGLAPHGGRGLGFLPAQWAPPIEVLERDHQLVVRAELPGLSKDDVKVEVMDDMLTIAGERRDEHEENRQGYRHSERRYGRFFRRLPLPEGVKAEDIRATFQNGVLEITMPAPQPEPRGRRIEVQEGPSGGAALWPAGQDCCLKHSDCRRGEEAGLALSAQCPLVAARLRRDGRDRGLPPGAGIEAPHQQCSEGQRKKSAHIAQLLSLRNAFSLWPQLMCQHRNLCEFPEQCGALREELLARLLEMRNKMLGFAVVSVETLTAILSTSSSSLVTGAWSPLRT